MYSLIIIDDEDITRIAVNEYIQENHPHFEVNRMFSNGADAFQYLRENTVNVVITDIRMPRMDGLELSRLIYETFPSTIVIIISGYSEFEYAKKAINYGVTSYLLKPLDFQELSQNLTDAERKLDALHIETNSEEEDIQLFFTDLIGGLIPKSSELIKRFNQLNLDGSINDYKGCLMTILLEKNNVLAKWKYGQDNIYNALQNCIRMLLPQYHVYHLFRSGIRFCFIILSTQELPTVSIVELTSSLSDLLHFTCDIQIHSQFESINALAAGKYQDISASDKTTLERFSADENVTIQKAIEYIQAHFAEDISREDVAEAVFLSSAYFSRFFKQKTGLSFIDYLTTIRMQKAIDLLGTQMKIIDIANKVGYQSRNRFFINFRQYTGYNPTEYRRLILKMEDFHEK